MPKSSTLRLTVRTPHQVILDEPVRSLRVLTETGQVGLRPAAEPTLLPFEPGLVHAKLASGGAPAEIYIGTSGGLLSCDGERVTMMTSIAIVGTDRAALEKQFDSIMGHSNAELEARNAFNKLEVHILNEIRRDQIAGVPGLHHAPS